MNKKKSIGILGGMGAMATADLFQKITALTDAASDSQHIRVYIDSNTAIPDRTAAILEGGADPLPAMTESLRKLEACGADCIIIPCNTAHYFLPPLQALTEIPFLDMIALSAQICRDRFPGKTAAILATTGTLSAGLYQTALARREVPYLVPEPQESEALMRVIYQGVKAGAAPDRYRADLTMALEGLSRRGADYFLLGCTEFPVAFRQLNLPQPTVDATLELAKAAIRFCGYPVKSQDAPL